MGDPKIDLAGYNIKEWALILLLASVIIVFALFAIAVGHAIIAGEAKITISGDIDIGQFTGVIIAMAGISAVLIAQQLTARNQAKAVSDNDSVWLAEELAKIEAAKKAKEP